MRFVFDFGIIIYTLINFAWTFMLSYRDFCLISMNLVLWERLSYVLSGIWQMS